MNRRALVFNGLIVLLTAALVGVGVVQASIYLKQSRLMLGGIAEAKRAADAANASAEVARISLRALQRPFVAYDSCHWFWHYDETGATLLGFTLEVRLKNSGPLPTRELNAIAAIGFFDNAPPIGFQFPLGDGSVRGDCFIAPQALLDMKRIAISAADMQAVFSGRRKLYVWGKATYRDQFEDSPIHTARFCVFAGEFFGAVDPPEQLRMKFLFHSEHNSAD